MGGGGGGIETPVSASCTNFSIKSWFFSICFLDTPIPCSCPSRRDQVGSTFSEVKPLSESKPMWATLRKADGAEIIILLIPRFFFFFPPPSSPAPSLVEEGDMESGLDSLDDLDFLSGQQMAQARSRRGER